MEKYALVIGASGGVGQALATELEKRNYHLTRLSRQKDGLDITSEENVSEKLGRLENKFDLVIVATGILSGPGGPEKSIRTVSAVPLQHDRKGMWPPSGGREEALDIPDIGLDKSVGYEVPCVINFYISYCLICGPGRFTCCNLWFRHRHESN